MAWSSPPSMQAILGPLDVPKGATLTSEVRKWVYQQSGCSAAIRKRKHRCAERQLTICGNADSLNHAFAIVMPSLQYNVDRSARVPFVPSSEALYWNSYYLQKVAENAQLQQQNQQQQWHQYNQQQRQAQQWQQHSWQEQKQKQWSEVQAYLDEPPAVLRTQSKRLSKPPAPPAHKVAPPAQKPAQQVTPDTSDYSDNEESHTGSKVWARVEKIVTQLRRIARGNNWEHDQRKEVRKFLEQCQKIVGWR